MPKSFITALHGGMRLRGAELMSYNGGMVSAAHQEADVDQTVAMFDDLVGELVRENALPRL